MASIEEIRLITIRAAADVDQAVADLNKLSKAQGDVAVVSETTGLSTTQLQALTHAAAEHGVAAEQTIRSIEKFTAAFDELRKGSGTMLTQISAVDGGLASMMMRTKDPAAAFELLTQAINKADAAGDLFARNALARSA